MDETLRIWIHDYESKYGTAVGQDDQNQTEIRRKETWLLAFPPGHRYGFDKTTVHCSSLAIRIMFPNHREATLCYVENLRALIKKCQGVAERSEVDSSDVGALALHSERSTGAPSEAFTRRDSPIYYKVEKIGEGKFGEVYKIIKARDGKIFAGKIFKPPLNRNKRRRDELNTDWLVRVRREFTLMRDNPHVSVLSFIC